jgi:CBS domain-containing protein
MVFDSVATMVNGRRPVTVTPGLTVREAASVLAHHRIGAAPVVDHGRLVGMFTERDVMNRVIAEGRDPQATTVEQVMTPEPTTVAPSASIVKAFDLMVEGAFRHLPVVDGDGHIIGVVSMRDVPLEYRILHQRWSQWMAADGSTTAVSPV